MNSLGVGFIHTWRTIRLVCDITTSESENNDSSPGAKRSTSCPSVHKFVVCWSGTFFLDVPQSTCIGIWPLSVARKMFLTSLPSLYLSHVWETAVTRVCCLTILSFIVANFMRICLVETNPTVSTIVTHRQVEDIMTFSHQLVPVSKLLVVTCKLVPTLPIGSYPSILSVWILSVWLFIRLLVRVVLCPTKFTAKR